MMSLPFLARAVALAGAALTLATPLSAQSDTRDLRTAWLATDSIIPLELTKGRSYPLGGVQGVSKVTVADQEIADVLVVSENDVVINALKVGETDLLVWSSAAPRRHFRLIVRNSPNQRQVLLSVKFAEVRKSALRDINASLRLRNESGSARIGTGAFSGAEPAPGPTGPTLPSPTSFFTLLNSFNSRTLLGFLDAQEQLGNARLLAEPNLMASNGQSASFLAGGEVPIPMVQPGVGGAQAAITISYREYGIRLTFTPEVLSDSLVKLKVEPEVSSLDYSNSLLLSGFRVPALRTRRVESTVDVLSERSLIISGMFNEERSQVRTGLPFLSNVPILKHLFASQQWQNAQSELLVVVTPIIMDPNNPRAADLVPTSTAPSPIPARELLEARPRVTVPPAVPPVVPPAVPPATPPSEP